MVNISIMSSSMFNDIAVEEVEGRVHTEAVQEVVPYLPVAGGLDSFPLVALLVAEAPVHIAVAEEAFLQTKVVEVQEEDLGFVEHIPGLVAWAAAGALVALAFQPAEVHQGGLSSSHQKEALGDRLASEGVDHHGVVEDPRASKVVDHLLAWEVVDLPYLVGREAGGHPALEVLEDLVDRLGEAYLGDQDPWLDQEERPGLLN